MESSLTGTWRWEYRWVADSGSRSEGYDTYSSARNDADDQRIPWARIERRVRFTSEWDEAHA